MAFNPRYIFIYVYLFLTVSLFHSAVNVVWIGTIFNLLITIPEGIFIKWMNKYLPSSYSISISVLDTSDTKLTKARFLPLRHSHKRSVKTDKSKRNGPFIHDSKRVLYKSSDISEIKSSVIFQHKALMWGVEWISQCSKCQEGFKLVVLSPQHNQKFPLKHTVEKERERKRKGRPFRELAHGLLPEQSDPLCWWSKRSDPQMENQSPRVAG